MGMKHIEAMIETGDETVLEALSLMIEKLDPKDFSATKMGESVLIADAKGNPVYLLKGSTVFDVTAR